MTTSNWTIDGVLGCPDMALEDLHDLAEEIEQLKFVLAEVEKVLEDIQCDCDIAIAQMTSVDRSSNKGKARDALDTIRKTREGEEK